MRTRIFISEKPMELNIIGSVEELPNPCRTCEYIDFYGFGINRVTCKNSIFCEHEENLRNGNYAMFPKKVSEIFQAAWGKKIRYPKWFFKILFVEGGKPAWRVAFNVEGVPYCYILKGTGKGTCRRLTDWELRNQKILECSYEEAEKWSNYFETKKT
jgi:hypothetical protein